MPVSKDAEKGVRKNETRGYAHRRVRSFHWYNFFLKTRKVTFEPNCFFFFEKSEKKSLSV